MPLLTRGFPLGTQAMFLFSSSLALSRFSFFCCEYGKPSGRLGWDFGLCTGKFFLTLGISGLACPNLTIGSLKFTCFTFLSLAANIGPAGFLSFGVGSEIALLRPSFSFFTFLTLVQ